MSDIDDYSSDDNEVFEINQNKFKQPLLNAGKIQTNKIQKKNIDAYMEDNEDNEDDDNVDVDEDEENEYDDNNEEYNKSKIKKSIGKSIDDINDDEDEDEDDDDDEDENKSNDADEDDDDDDELYKQEGGVGDNVNDEDDFDDEDINEDDDDDDEGDINEKPNKKTIKKPKNKANLIQPSLLNIDKETLDYGDDDDEDDEDDENYLQKFDKDINKNYIVDYHPECIIHNYDEVIKLTHIVRDSNNIIIDPLHRTIPFLTKYERARVLGQRSKQIEAGAKPFVKVPENVIDSYVIAELELQQKRIPFIIRRPLPSGAFEYWNLSDLENILF